MWIISRLIDTRLNSSVLFFDSDLPPGIPEILTVDGQNNNLRIREIFLGIIEKVKKKKERKMSIILPKMP
jgi:hypothetical protein